MSQASASADRIYELLDTKNDVRDRLDAIPESATAEAMSVSEGHIDFVQVWAEYETGDQC